MSHKSRKRRLGYIRNKMGADQHDIMLDELKKQRANLPYDKELLASLWTKYRLIRRTYEKPVSEQTLAERHEHYLKQHALGLTQRPEYYRKRYEAQRDYYYRRNYGITLETYEKMSADQKGACAICNSTDPGVNVRWLAVDHDHKTGVVRQLLCRRCNQMLGSCEENPWLLEQLRLYIVRHTPNQET